MPFDKPLPNIERWVKPPQGPQVNWLLRYRESEQHRRAVHNLKISLFSVPPLAPASALISEMKTKYPEVDSQGRRLRTTIDGKLVDTTITPAWAHADVLNTLHSIVSLFPGSKYTINRYKNEAYAMIEKQYGSPYDTSLPILDWHRRVMFAIDMAVTSVRESRSEITDRCAVRGLTNLLNDALETCVAENAGMTLAEYRNHPSTGEHDMAIQDTDNQPNNPTAQDLAKFEEAVNTFNPAIPADPVHAMPHITMSVARMYVGDGETPINQSIPSSTETTTLNQETIDMTNATNSPASASLAAAATDLEQASTAIPRVVKNIEQSTEDLVTRAAKSAQTTLNNAGDQLHQAAAAIKQSVAKPSFWKKVGKVAAIGAGIAAVGGAAYVAYRYFKDGETPAEAMNDVVDAAAKVVDKVAG